MEQKEQYCDEWDGDAAIPLDKLAELIEKLKEKYGAKATIYFDAGANNVSVMVKPTKKIVR